MFKTPIGDFNGDSWEDLCQICFKIKYEQDNYQPIPASPGDYGLEGFNSAGDGFQCYCPDENYEQDELYEKQRDKITRDLNKLKKYVTELGNILNGTTIKRWIFVTPTFNRNKILNHCSDKTNEYKALNLSILDSDFKVLIYDYQFFAEQIPIALELTKRKIDFQVNTAIPEDEIKDFSSINNELINNAQRKHKSRLPDTTANYEVRINKLTNLTIKDYLIGDQILKKWEISFQQQFEKFLRVVSQFEDEVDAKCQIPTNDNNERYKEIMNELKIRIKSEFPVLSDIVINDLTERVIADWILRCPLNFE